MYILGISCYYHDSAAVILKDGMLIAAAEEERFSRKKHDYSFPDRAINFCLREAGITARDLNYAVFYEKPLLKFERLLLTNLQTFPRSWDVFRESMIAWFNEKLWIKVESSPDWISQTRSYFSSSITFLTRPAPSSVLPMTRRPLSQLTESASGRRLPLGEAPPSGRTEGNTGLLRLERLS